MCVLTSHKRAGLVHPASNGKKLELMPHWASYQQRGLFSPLKEGRGREGGDLWLIVHAASMMAIKTLWYMQAAWWVYKRDGRVLNHEEHASRVDGGGGGGGGGHGSL